MNSPAKSEAADASRIPSGLQETEKSEAGVTFQDGERLARRRIPNPDGLVATCRGKLGSVGTEGNSLNVALVSDEALEQSAGLRIPDSQDVIVASAGESLAVRAPIDAGCSGDSERQPVALPERVEVIPFPATEVAANALRASTSR